MTTKTLPSGTGIVSSYSYDNADRLADIPIARPMPAALSTKHLALPPNDIAAGLPVVIDDGSQYVYGAGLEEMVAGGNTYYYLADGLGSTMAIVDGTGAVQKSYTYDVYGEPTATGTLPNEFDFAGQQTDPTGLQYLRARYMDPETGVFLSREPLALNQDWIGNGYGYAGAAPTQLLDPSGKSPVPNPTQSRCFYDDTHPLCPRSTGCYVAHCDDGKAIIDIIRGAIEVGLDIESWFLVVSARQVLGPEYHAKIRDCALSPDCRADGDLLFQFRTVASADLALLVAGRPELIALLTVSAATWRAYKRVYDDPELRAKVGD